MGLFRTASRGLIGLRTRLIGAPAPRVAVVRLNGAIAAQDSAMRSHLSLNGLADSLHDAFDLPGVKAVALEINSPGGSPVQSGLIVDRIRALAEEKDVPVIAFAEDVAASGGYMLALAADEIFVHEASILGSIGVVAAGFGFHEAIARLGVERRLYTAGDHKALLDSFRPENPEDVSRLKDLQADIHAFFIQMVKDRRGRRLAGDEATLFNGDIFTGQRAVELGLVDGIGDRRSVLRERFGKKVRFHPVNARSRGLRGLFGARSGAAGPNLPQQALATLESRLLWNRYGL
ncbi:S49 family peptidase [Yunchengibacter salinarum]|uniref:S49 family peptidase n=1 Tax=Yunchengibacter salinarum TaxID=3133399 RepID=UPI0035B5C257